MNETTKFFMSDRKKRFNKKINAENMLKSIRKKGVIVPPDAHAYHCPFCAGWHLGHEPNKLTVKEIENDRKQHGR